MQEISDTDKLNLYVAAFVYKLISTATTYNDTIKILASTYGKWPNPIFA